MFPEIFLIVLFAIFIRYTDNATGRDGIQSHALHTPLPWLDSSLYIHIYSQFRIQDNIHSSEYENIIYNSAQDNIHILDYRTIFIIQIIGQYSYFRLQDTIHNSEYRTIFIFQNIGQYSYFRLQDNIHNSEYRTIFRVQNIGQ